MRKLGQRTTLSNFGFPCKARSNHQKNRVGLYISFVRQLLSGALYVFQVFIFMYLYLLLNAFCEGSIVVSACAEQVMVARFVLI